VLDRGVPFRFKAKGISMHPFIRHGDVITITPLFDNLPRYGDVVAFVRPKASTLVVHRVVGKRDGAFIIKGDNVACSDEPIPTASILGSVTKVERDGKEIYLGLGPERLFIAFLTRRGILPPLLLSVCKLARFIARRRAM
jgi:signal peptidase I